MTQMWLLWRPKGTISTTNTAVPVKVDAVSVTTDEMVENGGENSCCGCLAKLLTKLKKRQRRLMVGATTSKQSSFQCRYDPLSYALNFDASGSGSLLDDEDFYQFCAFSSRFVANPRVAVVATSR